MHSKNTTGKSKFLVIGLIAVVALSFLVGGFWSPAVCALGKVIAAGAVFLVVFSKLLAGISGVHFLL